VDGTTFSGEDGRWGGQSVARRASLPLLTPEDAAFAATVEAHTATPVLGGNAVELLLNGEQIFPAKLAAIRAARSTVNYAEYFFAEGPVGREIAEALAERSRAGVTANILLDGFGTLSMPAEHVEIMRGSGCRVVTFRPLGRVRFRRHNRRNHRRMLVVDGRSADRGLGVS
jgi:cardiolipin synthase